MNGFSYNQPLLLKKSPVVIVKTFVVLQLTVVALFFLSGVMLDYGDLYEQLPVVSVLSFHIAEAIGIFILETSLIFYIFFRWYKEYYDIQNDKIIHGSGIIFRRKKVIPIGTISSINYHQGPLARLTKYGHIELGDGSSNKIILDHIPEPNQYAELIAHLKNNIRASGLGDTAFSLKDVISRGEHERLEFKTSFRWDLNQNKVNRNLEKAAIKTIAAFLNSGGGQLIIGVDDLGNIFGLEDDYKSLPKPNADGFQNHFTNVFNTMIGPEFRPFIEMTIYKEEGKDLCRINVLFSNKPAYLRFDAQEEFFIRTGNGTTSLRLSEAASYIDSHWKGKLL
ncbi:MAG: putative DNA binding domain-containing protein [bacterium]|nr:putative DNA binding domain-containing protein [bacterium]